MPTLDATTMVEIQVIPQRIAPHSNTRFEIWSMMENWSLNIWIDQLKSKTRLGQRWKWRDKRKRPQRRQISRKLQCQRKGTHCQSPKKWSRLFVDHWRIKRTIMQAKRRVREKCASGFGLGFRANVRWAKWMCYCTHRKAQFVNLEAKTDFRKRWGMRCPNSRCKKWKYWHQYQSRWPICFLFGSGLGSFVQVIFLFKEWVSCNPFWN